MVELGSSSGRYKDSEGSADERDNIMQVHSILGGYGTNVRR